jgi:hypothetical protein
MEGVFIREHGPKVGTFISNINVAFINIWGETQGVILVIKYFELQYKMYLLNLLLFMFKCCTIVSRKVRNDKQSRGI